ncbi:hypothetical protein [Methylophilus sp. Leaf414]|uniref:hypothetical protein n=1 Tax=Methylophilus sp. Leaf414 TaxID=1736371 RepID=UPI0006F815F8|nr:hypothetical protein [Methylophilus sp. Leaf414]KQT37683.1 hypothetical protein ASG24_01420 [Methylophilus sp. Leaf414]
MKILEIIFNDIMQAVQPKYQLKDKAGKLISEGSLQIAECNLIDVEIMPGDYELIIQLDEQVTKSLSVTEELSHYSVQV